MLVGLMRVIGSGVVWLVWVIIFSLWNGVRCLVYMVFCGGLLGVGLLVGVMGNVLCTMWMLF